MTALDWQAVGCTVTACALIAWIDPAKRLQTWFRSRRRVRHAAGRGKPGTHTQRPDVQGPSSAERGEGAGYETAPSPRALFCGCEVIVDREIQVTPELALGHYIAQASKPPMVRA